MSWTQLQDAHQAELQAKGRSWKTRRNYRYIYNLLSDWHGCPARPAELRQGDLVKFVQYLRSRKSGYADASLSSIVRQFKALLNFGRSSDDRCIKLDEFALRRGLNIGQIKRPVPVALSTVQLRAILETAAKYDHQHARHPMFPFLAFLMMTGARRGEAARLRWKPSAPNAFESWWDFDGNCLIMFGRKTGAQRVVPLKHRQKLKEMLEVMRDLVDVDELPFVFGGESELAFGDKDRSKDVDVKGRNAKWPMAQLPEQANVKFRVKDLRSTNATYLANSALFRNLYALSGELGHDYAILVKHYAFRRELDPAQADANDVADVLGIGDLVDGWINVHRVAQPVRQGALLELKSKGDGGQAVA